MDGSGRRVRSVETWAAARGDYLAGFSAGEVCARHDLGLAALKKRARREGWRRADQPDFTPPAAGGYDADFTEDLDEELEAAGPLDPAAMTERAARLARRALDLGDLAAAQGWLRVRRQLHALAEEAAVAAAAAERDRLALQAQTARTTHAQARAAVAIQAAGPALAQLAAAAQVSSVHSVSPKTEVAREPATPAPPPPLNRHQRRKQARMAPRSPACPRPDPGPLAAREPPCSG